MSRAPCSRCCSAIRRCRTSSPFSGMDELSEEDKLTVARARRIERFLSQPFDVAAVFTGTPGVQVKIEDTVKGFKGIIEGKYDNLPEAAFYMVGTIEQAVEKAKKLARGSGLNEKRKRTWPAFTSNSSLRISCSSAGRSNRCWCPVPRAISWSSKTTRRSWRHCAPASWRSGRPRARKHAFSCAEASRTSTPPD